MDGRKHKQGVRFRWRAALPAGRLTEKGGVMDIWIPILFGLVLLVIGGDILVRGATSAAKALGVSPLMIGLTLVGFGTSTPELVTSLQAAFAATRGSASPMRSASSSAAQDRIVAEDDALGVAARGGAR